MSSRGDLVELRVVEFRSHFRDFSVSGRVIKELVVINTVYLVDIVHTIRMSGRKICVGGTINLIIRIFINIRVRIDCSLTLTVMN